MDPLVVVPQGVKLVGLFPPGDEGAGTGGRVVGAGVGGDEPVPLGVGDGLVGELLDSVSEVGADPADDAERVADGVQPGQAVPGVADLDPGVGAVQGGGEGVVADHDWGYPVLTDRVD